MQICLITMLTFASVGAADTPQGPPHPANNPHSPLMLAGDWTPEDPHRINFEGLPRIASEHAVVSDVRDAGGTRVNQHNYLVHFGGQFWVMWSDGPGEARAAPDAHRNVVPGHDRAGQRVSYAVSPDGLRWSEVRDLAGPPEDGYGWIARGFWEREGELLALVTRYYAPGYAGPGLQLHAFKSPPPGAQEWQHLGLVYDDAMNNFSPKLLPSGEWMMSRRDGNRDVHVLIGGTERFDAWESFPMAAYELEDVGAEEPYWWVLPEGHLVALYRDNRRSGFLYRAFSTDNGRTWTRPVRTNFPDARSKFSAVQLRDGRHVLVSNAHPLRRDPLCLSISEDGLLFDRMAYLVGGRHVDYPHVIEHGDYLYIAFAGAKQTVEVLRVRVADLDTITMPPREAIELDVLPVGIEVLAR